MFIMSILITFVFTFLHLVYNYTLNIIIEMLCCIKLIINAIKWCFNFLKESQER